MTLRGSYLAGIGVLVLIQLMTAFAAIGLLMRMSPAVQDILSQNVYSNAAAEDALAALLLTVADAESDQLPRFVDAVGRARQNVTEPEEIPTIDNLERWGLAVLAGEHAAVPEAVRAAEQLIAINRDAMRRADARALSLGSTGAWAAVTLTLIGFMASILVIRRTIFGVVEPVEELEAVFAAYHAGDRYRRCQGRAASQEMRRVFHAVNTVLDHANRVDAAKMDASDA